VKNSLKSSGWAFASESFLWHSFACHSDRHSKLCTFFERGAIMGYFANKMLFDLIVKAKEKLKERKQAKTQQKKPQEQSKSK